MTSGPAAAAVTVLAAVAMAVPAAWPGSALAAASRPSAAAAGSARAASSPAAPGEPAQPVQPGPPGLIAPVHRAALPSGEHYVCPAPVRPGEMECMAIVRSQRPGLARRGGAASRSDGFYSPAELHSAYKLAAASAGRGRGETIAVVDAYSDPKAAADLARYRSRYHLGRCMVRDGCLRIVNQAGAAAPLPRPNWAWAAEESVDLDMVSAICPNCRILLIEARAADFGDLIAAENTAYASGARYISNSWAGGEFTGEASDARFFDHPGTVIDFASGDSGYGPAFPADLQYVTSVGGTTLRHARNRRGWAESVWGSRGYGAPGTGSGCSALAAKPSWQRADDRAPAGCLNRTMNDVAAVGDPRTGVAVYDSYPSPNWSPGWNEFGGTSVATPIITAVYALAGPPEPRTYPAQYPYLHPGRLFGVVSGTNGSCERNRRYLCHGTRGYDGPTGLGTPDGTAAFASSAHLVTVLDPGTADAAAGARLSLRLTGLDSRPGSSLRWSAAGLPAGLAIRAVPHSTDAVLSGRLPAIPGAYRVTVTGSDGAAAGSAKFSIVTVRRLLAADPAPGSLVLASRRLCADGSSTGGSSTRGSGTRGGGSTRGGGTAAPGQPVRLVRCTGLAGQAWAYQSSGGPGAAGRLILGGRCLSAATTVPVLARCDGSPDELFGYLSSGALANSGTGRCLAATALRPGTRLRTAVCQLSRRRWQRWRLPSGQLLTGAGGRCLDNPAGSSALGARARVARCDGSPAELWSLGTLGSVRSSSRFCLDGGGSTVFQFRSLPDGTKVVLNFCSGTRDPQQAWLPGPGGELVNGWSGRCLAAGAPGTDGTGLDLQDCYGRADEVWDLN